MFKLRFLLPIWGTALAITGCANPPSASNSLSTTATRYWQQPYDLPTVIDYAHELATNNRWAEARLLLERAHRIAPERRDVSAHLAWVRSQLGEATVLIAQPAPSPSIQNTPQTADDILPLPSLWPLREP